MNRDYPNLCQPLDVCGLRLRNRMCSAPMGATDVDAQGTPGPRTLGFYEARARGGAAIVTVSELVVHPETDGSQMLHLSLKTPGQLAAFTYVADAIARHGAIPSIELSHSGQYAGTYMVDKAAKGELCQYGASDGVRPDGIKVKALTAQQIDSIVEAYAEAAALAQRAGFRMCMVHCGHGWLINQFLSPYFNKRTDEYGGSLENRTRLARRILQAIREKCGPRFAIEMRMSGSELFEGGYDLEEGVRIAQALEELVDIIHVSAGSYQFGFSITHPSMFRDHGCNVYLAAEIKKHVSKPVATLGGLSDPAQMEEIIASGQADLVAMGRGLLADPELPNKVMSNRGDEIVRCMRCFTCMAERPVTQTRRCSLNPRIGRELEGHAIVPVPELDRKRVLVVGGGIAGMVAAYTAAKRGHRVTLCEAGPRLGGILATEAAVPFKQDMYQLGITYATLCERAGVDIRLNTLVDAAWAEEFGADAAVVAVGSEPMSLSFLPVNEDAYVVNVEELYLGGAAVTDEVVVVGGGLTGAECALKYVREGKKVHLVEMRDGIAIDANCRHRPILLKEIEDSAIDVVVNARAKAVTAEGVTVTLPDGSEQLIAGTTVVSAIGQRSRKAAVEDLRDAAPWVRVIGDAWLPRNVTAAVYEGFHAALDI
ncbi:MAG: FAD-dependent oxidoreductase [Coriobacteriia bacterium]|nr:FAD-dependent oxidoreductase [Coriobacteriia bacterium]